MTKQEKFSRWALIGIGIIILIFGNQKSKSCPLCPFLPPTSTPTQTSSSTFTPTFTQTFTPTFTQTFTPTFTQTFTPTFTQTFTPTPTSTYIPTQIVLKIADFYDCINTHSGPDLKACWNLLSNRPEEYQDKLIANFGGLESFLSNWNKYKVGYRTLLLL